MKEFQIANKFLRQVRTTRGWPPLRTSPQYNLIRGYVDFKFPWEEEGNESAWFDLYKRPLTELLEERKRPVTEERKMKELGIAKKFLHQVRTTRGYGVTHRFPLHHSPFVTLTKSEQDRFRCFKEAMDSTLNHISQKTGEAYELVKIQRAVVVPLSLMSLLTFVAKKPNSVPETFLSMVCQMPECEEMMECMLKPDGEADWGANEDKVVFNYDSYN